METPVKTFTFELNWTNYREQLKARHLSRQKIKKNSLSHKCLTEKNLYTFFKLNIPIDKRKLVQTVHLVQVSWLLEKEQ